MKLCCFYPLSPSTRKQHGDVASLIIKVGSNKTNAPLHNTRITFSILPSNCRKGGIEYIESLRNGLNTLAEILNQSKYFQLQ